MGKTTKKVSAPVAGEASAADALKSDSRVSLLSRLTADTARWQKAVAILFFIAVWALLGFCESSLLARVESLSLFVFDTTFYDSILSVPVGALSLAGCFLVQFFHYPLLGATIYVLLLYAVYALVRKVFDVQGKYTLLALLPVVALLASNTQLGYWIFYLKMPGYWYMALLATILSLSAMLAYKRLGAVARVALLCVWVVAGYPLMGVYALVSALLMALMGLALSAQGKKPVVPSVVAMVVALLLVGVVPRLYYELCYNTVALENIYMTGVPVSQWKAAMVEKVEYVGSSFWHGIHLYWAPFVLLLLSVVGFVVSLAFRGKAAVPEKVARVAVAVVMVGAVVFGVRYWFSDNNFRVENKQNIAIWDEDWRAVADYAKGCDEPTRQIILNKNIALLELGRAGSEMFTYPDGGVLPLSPLSVHMTHTDGSLVYYHLGRFNYCYRWCMENAVEYGWRHEYLKNAVRSMLLSGEYGLASRYVNILKKTLFYRDWAKEMEAYINDTSLIAKEQSFSFPLKFSCYNDLLSVDDVVEKYVMDAIDANGTNEQAQEVYMLSLSDALSASDNGAFNESLGLKKNATPEFVEASLIMSLIKKDSKRFFALLNLYVNNHIKDADLKKPGSVKQLPRHYQEAVLLFLALDKGKTVQVGEEFLNAFINRAPGGVEANFMKFQNSVARTRDEVRKTYPQISEDRLNAVIATLLKKEFGNTYYYYYFFVKKIMTY